MIGGAVEGTKAPTGFFADKRPHAIGLLAVLSMIRS
jgi:hypothetical protein